MTTPATTETAPEPEAADGRLLPGVEEFTSPEGREGWLEDQFDRLQTERDQAQEQARRMAAEVERQAEQIEALQSQLTEAQQAAPEGTEDTPAPEEAPGPDPYDERFGPRSQWARDLELAQAMDDKGTMRNLLSERDRWAQMHQASEAAGRMREAQAEADAELPAVKALDEARAEALRRGDLAEAHRLAQERPVIIDRARSEAEGHAAVAAATEHIVREWARQGRLPDGTSLDTDGRIQELLAEKADLGRGGFEVDMARAGLDEQIEARRLEIARTYAETSPDFGLQAQPSQPTHTSDGTPIPEGTVVRDPQTAQARYADAERRGDLKAMIEAQEEITRDFYASRGG